ncbi:MAG: hypothetical protein Q9194_006344 [Teloschistes cf. exilis]
MTQISSPSDAAVVGILNQSATRAGKLPRASKQALPPSTGNKKPPPKDPWELESEDGEPPAKRPKSTKNCLVPIVQIRTTAPARGRPRATKSTSTVTGQSSTRQLRSDVAEEQHRQHEDDSDPDDSSQSGSQFTPEGDSDEDEKAPENDRAEESSAPQDNAEAGSDESEHGLELFGQDQDWKGITAATKRIGLSNNKTLSDSEKERPELESQRIKDLLKVIEGARQVYRSTTKTPEVSDAVTKLYQSVAELSEASCKRNKGQVVTDIYFHAVPKLVDLLTAVLKGRRRQLQDEDNLTVLEEVIDIQDCLFILCTKARGWRAKPKTLLPTKQPVQQIRPKIVSMRSGFLKEYDRRKVLRKRRFNQAISRAIEEARIQREKQECEEKQRKLEERRRQQVRALLEALFAEDLGARPGRTAHLMKDAHDKAMTIKDHYLAALKDPLLRNLLPEDMAERARCYKPTMEDYSRDHGIPAWVPGIR